MARLENLTFGLDVDSTKAAKELAKTRKDFSRFSKDIGLSLKKLATTAIQTGAILGGTFAAAAGASIQATKAIAKDAKSVGLSLKQWDAFAFAFKQLGLESDDARDALFRTGEIVGEARRGTAAWVDGLHDLGLTWKDLIDLPIEEQFFKILDAIGDIENETFKLTLLDEFFSDWGQHTGNLLAAGSEGIREWMSALTDVDAELRTNSVNAVKWGLTFNLLSKTVTNEFANAIGDLSKQFGLTDKNIKPLIKRIGDFVRNGVVLVVNWVAKGVKFLYEWRKVILAIVGAWVAYKAINAVQAIAGTVTLLGKWAGKLGVLISANLGLIIQVLAVVAALAALAAGVYAVVQSWDQIKAAASALGDFVVAAFDLVIAKYKAGAAQIKVFFLKAFHEVIKGFVAFINGAIELYNKIPEALRPTGKVERIGGDFLSSLKQAITEAETGSANAVSNIVDRMRKAGLAFDDLKSKGAAAGSAFADNFLSAPDALLDQLANLLNVAKDKILVQFPGLKALLEGGGVQTPEGEAPAPKTSDGTTPLPQDVKDRLRGVSDSVATSMIQNMQQVFAGGSFKDGLKNIFKNIAQNVQNFILETFTQKLSKSLFEGIFQPLLQAIPGAGKFFSAHEGRIGDPRDSREELILARANESILTPQQMGALMGRGSPTVNVNVSGLQSFDSKFTRKLNQSAPDIGRAYREELSEGVYA